MEVGDLCRIIVNKHTNKQLGDFVLITKPVGSKYVKGFNLVTGNYHHYLISNLEKLCKGEI